MAAISEESIGRRGVFRGVDETLNLAIGFALVALTFAAFAAGFRPEYSDRAALQLLANLLLLGTIHNGFTFGLFWQLPESKRFRESARGDWRIHPALLTLIFLGGVVLASKMLGAVNRPVFGSISAARIFTFVLLVLNLFHILRQTMGISLMYNQGLRSLPDFSAADAALLKRSERLERRAFHSLIAFGTAYGFLFLLEPLLDASVYSYCSRSLIAAKAACVLGIFFAAGWTRKIRKTNKLFYVARVAVYPLLFVSPVVSLVCSALHGSEYFFVCRQMYSRSAFLGKTAAGIGLIGIFWGAAYALILSFGLDAPSNLLADSPVLKDGLLYLALFASGTRTLHFYLDHLLFRMRDPRARENIGVLLVPARREPEVGGEPLTDPAVARWGGMAGIGELKRL